MYASKQRLEYARPNTIKRAGLPVWRSIAAFLPVALLAAVPRLTCPCQWPAYAGMFGWLGLAFLLQTVYLLPLTAACLTLAVGCLAVGAVHRRGLCPFLLGLAAAVLLVVGRFVLASSPISYLALGLLLTASVWNAWPRARNKLQFGPDGLIAWKQENHSRIDGRTGLKPALPVAERNVLPSGHAGNRLAISAATLLVLSSSGAPGADQPQWGQPWSRNLVSDETGLPDTFDPESGLNVKWTAAMGTQTHSTPIIARGCVLIGTNNDQPRDSRLEGDLGVLMCLDERDGHLVWQLGAPKLGAVDPYLDWPRTGMVSPATVEGDRVYMVTNRDEVVCLDLDGQADGNDGPYRDEGRYMVLPDAPPLDVTTSDADIIWLFDIPSQADVRQHDGAHSSILVHGDYLYLCTSSGVDGTHRKILKPDAPGLIVLHKHTGQLVARDREQMAPRTIHCTWSSPSLGLVGGRELIFFGGGDAVCYAFQPFHGPAGVASTPAALPRVWRFDCDPAAPKEGIFRWQDNRREGPSTIIGMPVFHEGRVYVVVTGDLWHGKPHTQLKCIDASLTGDITDKGEIWSAPLERHCMGTPAIANALVFITDCGRTVHCLDAETGHSYWTHRARGEFWASPLVADGKVYAGTRNGDFWVLAADKTKRVISSVNLRSPISGTATAANGVLYVATMDTLYALEKGARQVAATKTSVRLAVEGIDH